MKYDVFLLELSKTISVNLKTLHQCFIDSKIEINDYLNISTIRVVKQNFDNYLMYKAFSKFQIEYQSVSSSIHPTKITDKKGEVLTAINASDVGVLSSDEDVSYNYLFNELFYDSELEKENIKTKIEEVVIFSKIPKNSIKIPVAGGKSYSPDFAYVLNFEDGKKKLYFIVETKNTQEESLREEEKQKIKHAEMFFDDAVKITFKTQFSNKKIVDLIQDINNEE
jgi:type III restriction enzyme